MSGAAAPVRSRLAKFAPYGAVAFWLLYGIAQHGFQLRDLLWYGAAAAFILAYALIETRVERPRKSYYFGGLASTALAAFLIPTILTTPTSSSVVLATTAWLAVTAFLAIWVWHYERTEAL